MSPSSHRIVITSSWNGAPTPKAQHVVLTYDDSDPHELMVEIDAPYHDDTPPDCIAGSTWALWEHEVVELFLVSAQGPYLELEFGPHGHYLALWLTEPRVIAKRHLKIGYESRIEHNRWHGVAKVPKCIVPTQITRWNAFSIFGSSSNRQYLSFHPLPGKAPDFHQPEYFAPFPQPQLQSPSL